MRALIHGAPIEIEGEPAEIAELIELVTTQAVFIEHKHRWRIGELDGAPTVRGTCLCGAEREFDPHIPAKNWKETGNAGAITTPAAIASPAAGSRKCGRCGQS